MRIAHVTATYLPRNTGTGNVAHHNAAELVARGHEVHTFTMAHDGAPAAEQIDGVHIHRLHARLRYGNAAFLPGLYRRLRDFDLVHLHMPFYGGCEPVYLAAALRRTPLVITHHQDVHLSGPTGVISRLHDRLLGRRLFRHADRVCFTSLDYARASKFAPLLEAGSVAAAELPNGVCPQRFAPEAPGVDLAQRHGTAGKPVILFVGVLDRAHYFKGVDKLLQAVAELDSAAAHLVVVGDGDMRATYRSQAIELGLAERVHFAGYVPDEELPAYFRLADVTVLPSTTAGEAFGLVLLESLASGTPVIASRLPGVRTVVNPAQDGLLVPPGDVAALSDALRALLSLPAAERAAMGAAGRRKVLERYAWPMLGRQLEDLYRQVIDDRRREQGAPVLVEAPWR